MPDRSASSPGASLAPIRLLSGTTTPIRTVRRAADRRSLGAMGPRRLRINRLPLGVDQHPPDPQQLAGVRIDLLDLEPLRDLGSLSAAAALPLVRPLVRTRSSASATSSASSAPRRPRSGCRPSSRSANMSDRRCCSAPRVGGTQLPRSGGQQRIDLRGVLGRHLAGDVPHAVDALEHRDPALGQRLLVPDREGQRLERHDEAQQPDSAAVWVNGSARPRPPAR